MAKTETVKYKANNESGFVVADASDEAAAAKWGKVVKESEPKTEPEADESKDKK